MVQQKTQSVNVVALPSPRSHWGQLRTSFKALPKHNLPHKLKNGPHLMKEKMSGEGGGCVVAGNENDETK